VARSEPPSYKVYPIPNGFESLALDKGSNVIIGHQYDHSQNFATLYQLFPKVTKISVVGLVDGSLPFSAIGDGKIGFMTTNHKGFIYENGTVSMLPPLNPEDFQQHPARISAYGILGGSDSGSGVGPNHRVLWTQSGRHTYAVQEFPGASTLNDLGDIVGHARLTEACTVWLHDGTTLSCGDRFYNATDINNERQVVGAVWVSGDPPNGFWRGFVWNPFTGVTMLPPYRGHRNSSATAINDDGLIIGSSWDDAGPYTITTWENGVPQDLTAAVNAAERVVDLTSVLRINNPGHILATDIHGPVLLVPRGTRGRQER
jgi:hypothetical protein